MNLEECLPANLRGTATTITKVAAGLSGAGVYRVDTDGQAFVLKVSRGDEPLDAWNRRVGILQSAANAELAPRVVHVDTAQRAVLSTFVADRSFPALLATPATRDAALMTLGRTLRRVHDLPIPAGATVSDPRAFLATEWTGSLAGFPVPSFVSDAANAMLSEIPPPPDRAIALSHNDVNPSNLIYDGDRLLLLDWDSAGANDPLYDLATAALFLRMDEPTRLKLLSAHDGTAVTALPPRFEWNRRLVGALAGVLFLRLARHLDHAGATGHETLETTASLDDFYMAMRTGALSVATAEGRWAFGLALIKASVTA